MKKWLSSIGFIVFLTPFLQAQVRWEYIAFNTGNTSQGSQRGTPQVPMLALPGATVTICGYVTPGGACTNAVTTFTTAVGSGTCPTNQPLTRSNQPGCFSIADSKGNFGIWVASGQSFGYTIVTSFATYGPIAATAAGGGGGGSGFPFGLGATTITANSSNAALTGLAINGVTLNGAGSSSLFLNQAGGYSAPSASTGFPITLGSTSIAASSTTTAISGLTVDGVTPTTFGYLDATSSIQT